MEFTVSISKSSVIAEVNKVTSYVGSKSSEGPGDNTIEKVEATTLDAPLLERFWREAKGALSSGLSDFIGTITSTSAGDSTVDMSEQYVVAITTSPAFQAGYVTAISDASFSFFVDSRTATDVPSLYVVQPFIPYLCIFP